MNHAVWFWGHPCTCWYDSAVSRCWQFPALTGCPWWRDVNYCVENCLHWGWGGCIVISCTYQRLKMHIVDDVGNVLRSDVNCLFQKHLWQLSESCSWNFLVWNIIFLLLQSYNSCGVNPNPHFTGDLTVYWLLFLILIHLHDSHTLYVTRHSV